MIADGTHGILARAHPTLELPSIVGVLAPTLWLSWRSRLGGQLAARLRRHGPLDNAQLDALDTLEATTLKAERGQRIAEQGARLGGLIIVQSGLVGCCKHIGGTGRQMVAVHLPGDICNLDVAGDRPLDFNLVALSKHTEVAWVDRVAFDCLRWVGRTGAALNAVAEVYAATARAWQANMSGRRTDVRLAHLLCELDERGGYDGRHPVALDLTQGDLADCVGVSAVQLNRSVTSLRAAGLLNRDRRSVLIGDHAALADLAGFDPAYLG